MSDPIRQAPTVVGGGAHTQGSLRTGVAQSEGSRRTGWTLSVAPVGVDELTDVDAPPGVQGVLERQADKKVRPVSRAEIVADHVNAPTPHPAYDDLPSLTLLFANGMV